MPYMMRLKYTSIAGTNYSVCNICESVNLIGMVYGPIYTVYDDRCEDDNREENYEHKQALCYGCYFDQWMEVQPLTPFPDSIRDGRVKLELGNVIEDNATMEPGKGLVVKTDNDYIKWEHALRIARSSNGAESVEGAYNRLYRSGPDGVEVTIEGAV